MNISEYLLNFSSSRTTEARIAQPLIFFTMQLSSRSASLLMFAVERNRRLELLHGLLLQEHRNSVVNVTVPWHSDLHLQRLARAITGPQFRSRPLSPRSTLLIDDEDCKAHNLGIAPYTQEQGGSNRINFGWSVYKIVHFPFKVSSSATNFSTNLTP